MQWGAFRARRGEIPLVVNPRQALYSGGPGVLAEQRQQALRLLLERLRAGQPEALHTLARALSDHFDPEIRQTIRRELATVHEGWIIRRLTEVWKEDRTPELRELALNGGWLPGIDSPARAFAAIEQGRSAALSDDPPAIAVQLICLGYDRDHGVRQRAREALSFLRRPETLDRLWFTWSGERQEWLASALHSAAQSPSWLRVLSLLQRQERFDPNPYPQELIRAARDRDPDLAWRAQAALLQLAEPIKVWREWTLNRKEDWLCELVSRLPLPEEPPELATRARLVQGAPLEALHVPYALEALNDPFDLSEKARKALGELRSQEAQQALCHLALADEQAAAIAKSAGFAPEQSHERALFFYLTEQWEAYQAVDFDHSLLRVAYEMADRQVRLRLNQIARRSGRAEWATVVSSTLRPGELSDTDWEALVGMLEGSGRHDDMARLARVAPPLWSQRLLSLLPDDPLHALARACSGANLPESLDSLRPAVQHSGGTGSVTSLVERPRGLVAGYQDGSICLLPDKFLPGHAQAVTSLSLEGGMLLSGGREGAFRLWSEEGSRQLDVLRGPVHAVALSRGAERAAVAGADRTVRIWDLTRMRSQRKITCRRPVNALCYGPEGLYYGGEEGCLRHEHGREWPVGAVIMSVAVSPDGGMLAAGGEDGLVRLWSPDLQVLEGHASWVTCLQFSPCGRLLVAGAVDGSVKLWRTADGGFVRSLQANPVGLSSLVVDRGGRRLIAGGDDGSVTVFEGSLLSVPVLQDLGRQDFEWIQSRLQDPTDPSEEAWIRFLLALHQQRFGHDVELDHSQIEVGSFAIQLAEPELT